MSDAATVTRPVTEAETCAAVEPAAESATARAKILLVDDEPKSLFALNELLSTLGENLMIAQSG
jgi:response regulator RpfG family c-di-GMP phosphodiesterase